MGTRQRPVDRTRRLTPRRSPEDNVRGAAAWVLERTLAASSPVDVFLKGTLERFDERDQGLLRELVLGSRIADAISAPAKPGGVRITRARKLVDGMRTMSS